MLVTTYNNETSRPTSNLCRENAAYAIMWCPSVRLSVCLSVLHIRVFCQNEYVIISSKLFSPSGSHSTLYSCFTLYRPTAIFRRGPAVEYGQKSRFSTSYGFIACCQRCGRQVLYTQLRRTVASWWHSSLFAISSIVCCSRETDDKVFMTRRINVTPKTTE